ncbi:MAG: L-glutamate gamma-semialdehyde dehydrogenase [Flavobacteriales bacterium]|nr:L-glutamate gamma-semialdehyde dehydrogenase [Flavobacteriales bacterium]
MRKGFFKTKPAFNEPIYQYSINSEERKDLKDKIAELREQIIDAPMLINGDNVFTEDKIAMVAPHDHKHILGYYNKGSNKHVQEAIESALNSKTKWSNYTWEKRASIFLKAADLVSGKYRMEINAATMLGQSKNAYQAEIDAACEFADFLRYNVQFMQDIYTIQPESPKGTWNQLEYRPLEGFVFALTPFNFTAIAGNLPSSAALMGNTVVWKPSHHQIYSCQVIIKIFKEAGLPDGVINLIYVDGEIAGKEILSHKDFAGIHFTGSTAVFKEIWKTIGKNISTYKSYPRIVGETGGKDFILVHNSAEVDIIVTALVRGAFEYQGQKCSAASRAYIPQSIWPQVKGKLITTVESLKIGPTEDFSNFINAVISEKSFDNLVEFIEAAKADSNAEIIVGGSYNKSHGYFIHPTVIKAYDPYYITMTKELFGPILTLYVYQDDEFDATLTLINSSSEYALTGSIISQDRDIINQASSALSNAAGNFYINDKPTGAVVGQQPFGGARASGTNDKAGSMFNLLRWVSPRTIKETLVPSTNYRYPFHEAE